MSKLISLLFVSLFIISNAYADFRFTYNGHTYDVITTAASWDNASLDATGKSINGASGYLTRIDDSNENTEIYNQLKNNIASDSFGNTLASDGGGASYVWIGASDIQTEGAWTWIDNNAQFWQGNTSGSIVGGLYNNWGNEPDDFDGQDAGAIALTEWPVGSGFLGVASQWNDVDDKNSLFYIIEYDSVNSAASASYVNNILTIPLVTVGELLYTAELSLIEGSEPFEFLLSNAEITTSSELSSATYSDEVVSIPVVTVGSSSYVVELTLTNLSPMQFILTRAVEITN
jgi:hypothetical protein